MRTTLLFLCLLQIFGSEMVHAGTQLPGFFLVKTVFDGLKQPDWVMTDNKEELFYQKANFTNQNRKEVMVIAPVMEEYQDEPRMIAFLFYKEMLKEIDENGNLKFWESHWIPSKWWEFADHIKTQDENRDGIIEIELTTSYNVEAKRYELYELITLRGDKVHPIYSNVSWQALHGSGKYRNFLLGDTLIHSKHVTYEPEGGVLRLIETVNTEIVDGMEPNGELTTQRSRGIRNWEYDGKDILFKMKEEIIAKPLITAASLEDYDKFLIHYETYKADKYRCSKIASFTCSSVKDENRSQYGPSNLVDTDTNSCWKEGAAGSGYNEWFEFEFEVLPNVDAKKDLPFTGFYVLNGDMTDSLSYYKAPRVRSVLVYVNQNPTLMLELADTPEGQILDLTDQLSFALGNLSYKDKLRIEIIEVYDGKRNGDASITEFIPFCMF